MSESVVVSDEFMEFYGKEADAIAAAQQAEASTGNIPFDIGTTGTVIVKSVTFEKAKDKEVDDPQIKGAKLTKKGWPTIKFVFQVIDHKDYSGVEYPKVWYMWKNDTKSQVQVYKDFLDELEKFMGLTREVRENPNFNPKMLGDFYTNSNPLITINFRVVEDAKNTFDGGKRIFYSIPKDVIPPDAGLVPTKSVIATDSTPTNSSAPAEKKFKIGDTVKYLEMDWKIEADMGGKYVLSAPGVESKIVKAEVLGNG